jgi:hypothetical protein
MRIRSFIVISLSFILLISCITSTPEAITALANTEFSLSVGQTVSITDAGLSITLFSVSRDERCPREIECAASGPVTINLSIRDKSDVISEKTLQTFTDVTGIAPTMEFEGIKSSVSVDDYQIKIVGVLPYPKDRSSSIEASEYVLTLKVTKH